jgi:hypothetical protein
MNEYASTAGTAFLIILFLILIALLIWWATAAWYEEPNTYYIAVKKNPNGDQVFTTNNVQQDTIYLKPNKDYKFIIDTPGYPFYLSTDKIATGAGNIGTPQTPIEKGEIIWTPKELTNQPIYYHCSIQPNMSGKIIIK